MSSLAQKTLVPALRPGTPGQTVGLVFSIGFWLKYLFFLILFFFHDVSCHFPLHSFRRSHSSGSAEHLLLRMLQKP